MLRYPLLTTLRNRGVPLPLVAIDHANVLAVSKMDTGYNNVKDTLASNSQQAFNNLQAVNRAIANLKGSLAWYAFHMGTSFGTTSITPKIDDTTDPATYPDLTLITHIDYNGHQTDSVKFDDATPKPNSMEAWAKKAVELGAERVILNLYQFPWWCMGYYSGTKTYPLKADGTVIDQSTGLVADPAGKGSGYLHDCRPITEMWPKCRNLIKTVVKHYAMPNNGRAAVRYFSVGHERKGFTKRHDSEPRWDMTDHTGTLANGTNRAGTTEAKHADMGYSWFYIDTFAAIKEAEEELRIATGDNTITLHVGGPYFPITIYDEDLAAGLKLVDSDYPNHPLAVERLPLSSGNRYGTFRNREWRAFEDWLPIVYRANKAPHFLTIDTRIDLKNESGGALLDPWPPGWDDFSVAQDIWKRQMDALRFMFQYVDALAINADVSITIPDLVISKETYFTHEQTSRDATYRTALTTVGMAEFAREGMSCPLLWSETGEAQGDEPAAGLITYPHATLDQGGDPQPLLAVTQAFHDHFGPNQPLYSIAVANPNVYAFASDTCVVLVNKTNAEQKVRLGINSTAYTLTPYETKIVDLAFASDKFNRADSAVSPGGDWVVEQGTAEDVAFGISNGRLYCVTDDSTDNRARAFIPVVLPSGAVLYRWVFTTPSVASGWTGAAVYFGGGIRHTAPATGVFWSNGFENTHLKLELWTGGTAPARVIRQKGTTGVTLWEPGITYEVKLLANRNDYQVWLNGEDLWGVHTDPDTEGNAITSGNDVGVAIYGNNTYKSDVFFHKVGAYRR